MSREVIHYADKRRQMGFLATILHILRNIVHSRTMIWYLFVRDFFVVNKRSFLGSLWLFISPLIGVLSWVFLSMTDILKPGDLKVPYPVYVLLGSSIWGLFVTTLNNTKSTLVSITGLVDRLNFPHEAIAVKMMLQSLAGFLASLIVNLLVLMLFRVIPSPYTLMAVFLLIPLVLFATAFGLFFSIFTVVFPDFDRFLNQSILLLMYTVPIVYASRPEGSTLWHINHYNPLTYLIGLPRDLILYGIADLHWKPYFVSCVLSVVLFTFSARLFFVAEETITEKIY